MKMVLFQVSSTAKVLSVLSALALASLAEGAFSPARISFESLVQQDDASKELFLRSLHRVGMISVTDIPYFDSKWETLTTLPACLKESPEWALEHTFPDGTRRQTLATHSLGNIHASPVPVSDTDACAAFTEASQTFRQVVGLVVAAFSKLLSESLSLDNTKPVLQDKSSNKPFSLVDIFEEGDQLDHFHCYYSSDAEESSNGQEDTIEWHTDQGLALIFTPGSTNGNPTDGFHIQLEDGSTEMVNFEKKDDLVILLGDGVNQYINRLVDAEHSLRALPHALQMPTGSGSMESSSPRVWYGRMMLPPASALYPSHPFTFGEIREHMIENGSEDDSSSLSTTSGGSIGCSGDMVARELSETTCEEGIASFCWHRCMNYTDYDVSPEICAEQELDLVCINEEGQLWPGHHDPAFAIGCVDLATAEIFTIVDDAQDVDQDDKGDTHGVDGHGDDDDHDASGAATGLHSWSVSFIIALLSILCTAFVSY
jgi:hypothetical protein